MSETTSVEMCPDCGRRIAPDCEAGTYGCKRRFSGYHSLCAELTVERFRDENAKLRSEVESLRARVAELEQFGDLDQFYADIVRAAMAFDEGANFGPLTAACARLRGYKSSNPEATPTKEGE